MTALLGGAPVVGAFGPDSVVAVYGAHSGTLQIEGARVGGGAGGSLPILRVVMSCAAAPGPGVYPVAGGRTPVHAEAYLPPRGVPAVWPRVVDVWPRFGALGPRVGASRGFHSDSTPPGVLELDTLDLAGGRIYGRFRAAVRSYDGVPAASLGVVGTFWGRVRTVEYPAPPGGRARWAPGFDRDCAAARRPRPPAAGPAAGAPTLNDASQLPGTPGGGSAPAGLLVRGRPRALIARR
jgi:hypothetical protein